jgi:Cu+-exporting ATPase
MPDRILCHHCGEDCGNQPVYYDGKPFCCHGCSTVFQLLEQNRLSSYYTLMDAPKGIRLPVESLQQNKRFSFLDREEVARTLTEFKTETLSRVNFYIPSIHCSSCIWLLENLHRMHPGVVQSSVNFLKKEVTLTFRHNDISLRQLADLLVSIHYIPEITLDSIEGKKPAKTQRRLIRQLGVAAFCFGNTMLFSFPEYLAIGDTLDPAFRVLFNYINLLLGSLVLFFSGRDYLISAWKNLSRGVLNLDLPISIGMLALFGQSTFAVVFAGGHGYFDSLAGFVFFLLIGKWYQSRTYEALSFERNYKSYFPVGVTLVRADGEESILLREVSKGDHLRIRNQELIPADGVLLEGMAAIDYSFVTGESKPVAPGAGEAVYAGGRQSGSSILIEITHEVDQSRLTQLWNQDSRHRKDTSDLQTIIDHISRYFVYGLLSVALLTLAYWLSIDPGKAVFPFVAVLIVACPCALALTLPFTFGNTQQIFGRQGCYLKKTSVVEDFARIDTVVFDKTGTITRADMLDVSWEGEDMDEETVSILRSLFRNSTHPLSVAVFKSLGDGDITGAENFREVPARGIAANINGVAVRAGSADFTGVEIHEPDSGSRVFVRIGERKPGYFVIGSTLRDGLDGVVGQLKNDYPVHLISGDSDSARRQLRQWFPDGNMHFGLSPVEKKDYILGLNTSGRQVLMIGDGLNDAGALDAARAGISVADNIYHFTPACDAILEASAFPKLHKFLQMARHSLWVIRVSFLISVLYNVIGLTFAVRGLLTPVLAAILMPASSVTVVAFTILATNWIGRKIFKQ